jgi:Outer membrane protein beta-barrel domain
VSAKSRPGLIIGGFLAIDKHKAGLVVEGLFSQNGTKLEFSDSGATFTQEIRIDYIVIPVLGRVNLKASDGVLVHLYLGPQFGFKTGFQSKETLTVAGTSTSMTSNDDDNIKGHNIDLGFGGQVDFGRFLVDLRYSLGLTNVDQDTGPEEPEVKNRTFSMMFGVRLK